MDNSKLIAGFIGPLFAAMGIAMLINHELFSVMIGQIAQNYALIFLSGILALLGGIAIVRVHNVWEGGWPVLITALGWLAIVGGLLRMWIPHYAAPIAQSVGGNAVLLSAGGFVVLALGAFLSYKAYISEA